MSNIKLSPKQKEVIQLMREGMLITDTVFGRKCLVKRLNNRAERLVLDVTYSALDDKALIHSITNSGLQKQYWELTELGKTIDIT